MGLLINIDTGGTLTDFCIIDGDRVHRTKSVTTSYDLSKCLIDGLIKASRTLYGQDDLQSLLLATDHIRYSTTQGTNALVERKGPRLGLICLGGLQAEDLVRERRAHELFDRLIGNRSVKLDVSQVDAALDHAATAAVNQVAVDGATRLVVSGAGPGRAEDERRVKRLLLRKFPPHLLGALPILYAHELVADDDDVRRTWTALFNAFLHPPMEKFLYGAEQRLRSHKIQTPLLIFRNDGGASRVARTTAVRTYSSGPRGGAEGLRALADHYGFENLVGMDIGGTTTDIALVQRGKVRTDLFGTIEGVPTSLPLCNVVSVGVGGSSIIRVTGAMINVGPESVGSTPGPACFGFGGSQATMTDAFVAMGLLDPATYFGGELALDISLAHSAIDRMVAQPLGLNVEQTLVRMENAWVAKVVDSLRAAVPLHEQTILTAFGGAGPLVATKIAAAAGIDRVLIPGLAAVFSAFGVGFSDIFHEFEAALDPADSAGLADTRQKLLERARRAMFAEGVDLAECAIETRLLIGERTVPLAGDELPPEATGARRPILVLRASKSVPRAKLTGSFGQTRPRARMTAAKRRTLLGTQWRELPLLRVEDQLGGTHGEGPVVMEEAFFTARIDVGWRFECDPCGDILLTRVPGAGTR